VRDFSVVKKANPSLRTAYTVVKWLTLGSGLIFLVLACMV
jgi:hypothetical protein